MRYIIAIVPFLFPFFLLSQTYVGIQAGGNYALNPNYGGSIRVHIVGEKNINPAFSLQSEVGWAEEHIYLPPQEVESDLIYVRSTSREWNGTFLAKARLAYDEYQLSALAGPFFAYRYFLVDFFNPKNWDKPDLKELLEHRSRTTTPNYGLAVGVELNKKLSNRIHLVLSSRYYIGINNISREKSGHFGSQNLAILIGAMLPISREKIER